MTDMEKLPEDSNTVSFPSHSCEAADIAEQKSHL
jgi:hypothetical protein